MKVILGSLLIFQILNIPQNLDDIAYILKLFQRNILLLDKSLASSFDSIELKTSNANKGDFLVCDQSLSILIVSALEKPLNVCILLDYTIFLCKISMASRKERNLRSVAEDREKILRSSSKNSHLYENSLPIAKKVSLFFLLFQHTYFLLLNVFSIRASVNIRGKLTKHKFWE